MTIRQQALIFRFASDPQGNLAAMRIRRGVKKDGMNVAVSVNVNEPGSVTAASSTQHAGEEQEVTRETGQELPDREGTWDELREEATKDAEEAPEGEQVD
jgi:hypothetical protein